MRCVKMEIDLIIDSIIKMDKCKRNIEYLSRIDVGQTDDIKIKELIEIDISNLTNEYSLEFEKIKKYSIMYLKAKHSLLALDRSAMIEASDFIKNNIPSIKMIDGLFDDIQEITAKSSNGIPEKLNDIQTEDFIYQKISSLTNQLPPLLQNQSTNIRQKNSHDDSVILSENK